MTGAKRAYIDHLEVEVSMLDPYNFDPENPEIYSYVEQFLRAREAIPSVGTMIPIQIGMSSGLVKIARKEPHGSWRLPLAIMRTRASFLTVRFKSATARPQGSRWQYRPTMVEPVWEDDRQVQNARLLRTFIESKGIERMSPLILLEGEPGTGKTMVADNVLSDFSESHTILRHVTMTSSYIGETAHNIMEAAQEAMRCKPSILLLEECDGLFLSRWLPNTCSTTRHHIEEVIPTLLQCIDQMAREGDIFIVATTNLDPDNKHNIDPAVLSRVGLRLSFSHPDSDTLERVMAKLCERRNVPVESVKLALVDVAVKRKPSYRDIEAAISRVKLMEKAGVPVPRRMDDERKPPKLEYIQ